MGLSLLLTVLALQSDARIAFQVHSAIRTVIPPSSTMSSRQAVLDWIHSSLGFDDDWFEVSQIVELCSQIGQACEVGDEIDLVVCTGSVSVEARKVNAHLSL